MIGRHQWRHDGVVRTFWEQVLKRWEEVNVSLLSWITFLRVSELRNNLTSSSELTNSVTRFNFCDLCCQEVFDSSESRIEGQLVSDFLVNSCAVASCHDDVLSLARLWRHKLHVFATSQVAMPRPNARHFRGCHHINLISPYS